MFRDVNGIEIKIGDKIRCLLDGSVEEVFECESGLPGILASKEELYPLSEFDTEEDWEII